MNLRDASKLIVLFVVTYIILFFLPAITKAINPGFALHDWGFTLNPSMLDYTFYLMPLIGFFFIFFLIDWANDYFKTSAASSIYFPLLFVVLSFIAFYVQLYWYYSNLSSLAAAQGQTVATTEFFEFWAVLRDSAFLVFIFSGLGGWLSHKAMQSVSESALEEKRKQKPEAKKQEKTEK